MKINTIGVSSMLQQLNTNTTVMSYPVTRDITNFSVSISKEFTIYPQRKGGYNNYMSLKVVIAI